MRLTTSEIEKKVNTLHHFALEKNTLKATFLFNDFNAAWAFLTQIALFVEKSNHHPNIVNIYNKVELTITTHDENGLTKLDFDFALFAEKNYLKYAM